MAVDGDRKQYNVRLSTDLIKALEERRATTALPRDRWAENFMTWALSLAPPPASTPQDQP